MQEATVMLTDRNAGAIIGTAGATRRKIVEQSGGAKLTLSERDPTSKPNARNRTLTITGTPAQVAAAMRLVDAK